MVSFMGQGGRYEDPNIAIALINAKSAAEVANARSAAESTQTLFNQGLAPWHGYDKGPEYWQERRLDTPQWAAQNLAEQKFGLQKDWLGKMGDLLSKFSQDGSAKGPEIAQGPQITPGPVFSPEEMVAQQNMVRDRSMQQVAGQTERMVNRLASRGVGGNSPLMAAIQNKLELAGRVGGEQGALDFSRQAAEANAKNILQSHALSQSIYDAHQKNLINKFQAENAARNQLLQIFSSLVGII